MQYKNLIFDIDGTLWDARALSAEAWNQQLIKEGYPQYCLTPDQVNELLGKTTSEIADIVLFDMPDSCQRYALMIRCMEAENQYLASNECLVGYPKVTETIATLAENHRLFLVSNCDKGYPEICIDKLGLTPYIQDHLCYGDTLSSKAETIRILMTRNHIADAVYIGDTQGDYKAATEAGIPFIWAAYGFGTPDDCTKKISKIEELLSL